MFDFDIITDATQAAFGETVILRRPGLPDLPVSAIYDSRHFDVETGEMGGSDLITTVTISKRDAQVRQGDIIEARGVIYRVTDPQEVGDGNLTLPLERVP